MSAQTKTIQVEFAIPVTLELRVRWDEGEETAVIESAAISHIQADLSPDRLSEHMSEDDFQELDRITMKAFGIEST